MYTEAHKYFFDQFSTPNFAGQWVAPLLCTRKVLCLNLDLTVALSSWRLKQEPLLCTSFPVISITCHSEEVLKPFIDTTCHRCDLGRRLNRLSSYVEFCVGGKAVAVT
jgi:hypothetical protein